MKGRPMKVSQETITKICDLAVFWGEKYKNDAVFRQKIDNGTIDIQEEFGIDAGDTEVVIKVNNAEEIYFIMDVNTSSSLSDTDE